MNPPKWGPKLEPSRTNVPIGPVCPLLALLGDPSFLTHSNCWHVHVCLGADQSPATCVPSRPASRGSSLRARPVACAHPPGTVTHGGGVRGGFHDLSLGLQPYPQKVVRPPWHPPQPPSQEVVGALGFVPFVHTMAVGSGGL